MLDLLLLVSQTIYVTGGTSLIPNFAERLTVDVRHMRPYGSSFSVVGADNKLLDGWRGASEWGKREENRAWFVSRAEYLEKGGEFMKEHPSSNPYLLPPSTQTDTVVM